MVRLSNAILGEIVGPSSCRLPPHLPGRNPMGWPERYGDLTVRAQVQFLFPTDGHGTVRIAAASRMGRNGHQQNACAMIPAVEVRTRQRRTRPPRPQPSRPQGAAAC